MASAGLRNLVIPTFVFEAIERMVAADKYRLAWPYGGAGFDRSTHFDWTAASVHVFVRFTGEIEITFAPFGRIIGIDGQGRFFSTESDAEAARLLAKV